MKRWFGVVGCTFFLVLVSLFSGNTAFAARTLYETFSNPLIDKDNWVQLEQVREVADGRLHLTSATSTGRSDNRLILKNASGVNTIQADINIVKSQLGEGQWAYASVEGVFYNTLSASPTSIKGDVGVRLVFTDFGDGDLVCNYVIQHSLSDDGSNNPVIKEGGIPGSFNFNTFYSAKIEYDGGQTFVFSFGGNTSGPVVVGLPRVGPSSNNERAIEAIINAENNTSYGHIAALFDNVRTGNPLTLYDDFNAAPLNPLLWVPVETVREIRNNRLCLFTQAAGSRSQETLFPTNQETPYLEAKVAIDGTSAISPGARAIARLAGYFYNDSRGPGSGLPYDGYTGEVFAQAYLLMRDDRSLQALISISRVDSADESASTVLLGTSFTIPIHYDRAYTLSIQFKDNQFVFKCNDESITYNITTPIYPSFDNHRQFRTRIYADPGETGYVKAYFDDIYTLDGNNIRFFE